MRNNINILGIKVLIIKLARVLDCSYLPLFSSITNQIYANYRYNKGNNDYAQG